MDSNTIDGPDKTAIEESSNSTIAKDAGESPPTPIATYALTIRGRQQRRTDGRTIEAASPAAALFTAIDIADYPAGEPVIEAGDCGDVAFVDVDYHCDRKPERIRLMSMQLAAQPSPVASWVTHGGGLRLAYVRNGPLRADEIAALGAL